jgi:hypothetical protein
MDCHVSATTDRQIDSHTAEATAYADNLHFPLRLPQHMFLDRNPAVGLERRRMTDMFCNAVGCAVGHAMGLDIVCGGIDAFACLDWYPLLGPLLRPVIR